jgi:hypothetical protein
MKLQNLKFTIQQNQSKPCSVSGCSSRRHRLYNVCLKHHAHKANFGHPKASAIQKKELRGVRAEVSSLVERNESTHVGMKNAISWFERWLTDATDGKQGVPGRKHIQRLATYCVSARELLTTCGAVWLFSYRNAHRLPTEKALAFALAHQIMKLIPLEYSTTSSGKRRAKLLSKREREDIGEYIRQSLGVLFVNMVKTINGKEEREMDFKNQMAKPLS